MSAGNAETVSTIDLASGELEWSQAVGGGVVGLLGARSETILVGGYELVVGIDARTGEERWRLSLESGLWPAGSDRDRRRLTHPA